MPTAVSTDIELALRTLAEDHELTWDELEAETMNALHRLEAEMEARSCATEDYADHRLMRRQEDELMEGDK